MRALSSFLRRCIDGLTFAAALLLFAPALAQQAPREPVTVFAAASLKDAVEEIGRGFTAATGTPVRFSFAASSALARQIEQGAPADLFASADVEWMDYLAQRGHVRAETRADLLSNRLVLVAPASSTMQAVTLDAAGLGTALGPDGRIATGEVTAVPAGRYARAALDTLGLWQAFQPRLAQAENVRAALAFVARGEAPLGIVYETDAIAEPRVKVVARFPAESHVPITYPFAITKDGKPGAAAFLDYVKAPAARAVFERSGFTVLEGSAKRS
ncbi:MAG TPA: molybdate ABC transporter substrate-binding protein [Beijerinckiaceae bacterium]|jgi:molybdate transport system substrate-binding protein